MYFAAVVALMLVFPLTSIGVQIVRELGFANTAIGSIGIASLFFRDWDFRSRWWELFFMPSPDKSCHRQAP
jgi:hypothetical protein